MHVAVRSALGVCLLVPILACAQGPERRVTLTLRDVTAAEAAAALSRAVAVPVRIAGGSDSGKAPPARAGFQWSGVTLGAALRELCSSYRLTCQRLEIGYQLSGGSETAPPVAPPPAVPVWSGRNVKVIVEDVSWKVVWNQRRFGGADTGEAVLAIRVRCETGDRDAESLFGFADVEASDDHGNRSFSLVDSRLRSRRRYQYPVLPSSPPFPDRWTGEIELAGVDPHAGRLAWVEGELLSFRRFVHSSVDLPYRPGQPGPRLREGGFDIEVDTLPPRAPAKEGEMGAGPTVEVRLGCGALTEGTFPINGGAAAELVGASGRVYEPLSSSGTGGADDGHPVWRATTEFAPVPEPVVTVRAGLHAQVDPRTLTTFRLRNIPVPPVPADLTAPPRAGQNAPQQPFFAADGGELLIPVSPRQDPRRITQPIGLSRWEGRRWSPLRWVEADLDERGWARVRDLCPGRYRVRQAAQGNAAPREVTVSRGKPSVLGPVSRSRVSPSHD